MRCVNRGLVAVMLLVLVIPPALAPAKDRPTVEQVARGILQGRVSDLERDIADRILRKSDAAAGQQTLMDAQIDLRLVERGILQAALRDPAVMTPAYLRSIELTAAEAQVDALASAPAGAQTALAALHQQTFHLDEIKNAGDIDKFCNEVGQELLPILGLPAEAHPPAMRPPPTATTAPAPSPSADEPRTLSALIDEVQHLNVSPTLRRELLTVSGLLQSMSNDPDKEKSKDASEIQKTLNDAVDLAKGAQTGAADVDTRTLVETQLSQGLALLTDPRLRSAGVQRIDALHQYRRLLVAVDRLHLNANQQQQFSPAIAYAQKNLDQAQKVMSAIDSFLSAQKRIDAIPANPPMLVRGAEDSLKKQVDGRRGDFMTACADIAAAGGADALEQRAHDFRHEVDMLELIDEMPAANDVLLAFHPKPAGALEQKISIAAQAVANPAKPELRGQGEKFLRGVRGLARVAGALNKTAIADVPSPIMQAYAGATVADVESHWKKAVTDLASSLAGGSDVDMAKVNRLAITRNLLLSLRDAPQLEAAATKAQVLTRWVDWTVTPDALQQMLAGYKQEMSMAFSQMMTSDASDALDRWKSASNGYAPLLALLQRVSGYSAACAQLPDTPSATAFRLMTPLEGQPFSAERYVSFTMGLWSRSAAATDQDSADAAFIAAITYLKDHTKPATQPAADPLNTPLERIKKM